MKAKPLSRDALPLTDLMAQAMTRLSELPAARQDELAGMLIDAVESEQDRLGLTPEQWGEVEAALAEEGDNATEEELAAFFARYRG